MIARHNIPVTVVKCLVSGVMKNRFVREVNLRCQMHHTSDRCTEFHHERLSDVIKYPDEEDCFMLLELKRWCQLKMLTAIHLFLGLKLKGQVDYIKPLPSGLSSACKSYIFWMIEINKLLS